ncbi:NAD-dependent epimerase/dehydratase family protein [Holosporaceae bacterium 'Namur']|nr:NAD-dependent epimerase/dehydratase family protein [Holosporaceae bacterium 'Namur']
MKYLVTGGAGFIGSHLTEQLLEYGHDVTVLDNLSYGKEENLPKECNFIQGDILDVGAVREAFKGVDGCFHLAAVASVQQSVKDWINTHKVNLTGTINIFEEAAKQNVPVVYASSAAVYGNISKSFLTEDLLPQPISGYAADKYACELQAKAFGAIFALPTFGLRFFNVYGARQLPDSSYSGVISIFLSRIKNKEPLNVFGDGNQTRDFIYVKDVVNFTFAAMQKASAQAPVVNICTGKGTTVNELAQKLFSILGEVNIEYLPAKRGDALISLGSSAKAEQILKIKAQTLLEEGLKELVDSK